jgi:hypothetical protein
MREVYGELKNYQGTSRTGVLLKETIIGRMGCSPARIELAVRHERPIPSHTRMESIGSPLELTKEFFATTFFARVIGHVAAGHGDGRERPTDDLSNL